MPVETSQTIHQWGQASFGPVADPARILARARLEFDELVEAIDKGESLDAIIAEAADVAILLHRLAGFLDRDLSEAIDAKMAINRARAWIRDGDGTGRHV